MALPSFFPVLWRGEGRGPLLSLSQFRSTLEINPIASEPFLAHEARSLLLVMLRGSMKKQYCVRGFLVLVLLAVVLTPYPVILSALPDVPGHRLKGASKAAVVITEYSDFQCPSCAKAQSGLLELLGRHQNEVILVFRHYPLRMHRWAFLAAQAAESAGAQGKFWEYQKILFERQAEWDKSENARDLFVQYAGSLGLDTKRFADEMAEGRWDAAILKDIEDAKARNVNVTPTFFINDRRLVGEGQLREYGETFVTQEKTR